jgi:hypothetical protein
MDTINTTAITTTIPVPPLLLERPGIPIPGISKSRVQFTTTLCHSGWELAPRSLES